MHPTHYGRICPIETPEGPNIGLIVSLSTYARVNAFGFMETPYRLVKGGQVTRTVKYMSALDEKDHPIAQANAPLDAKGRFVRPMVSARVSGEFVMVKREEIEVLWDQYGFEQITSELTKFDVELTKNLDDFHLCQQFFLIHCVALCFSVCLLSFCRRPP